MPVAKFERKSKLTEAIKLKKTGENAISNQTITQHRKL